MHLTRQAAATGQQPPRKRLRDRQWLPRRRWLRRTVQALLAVVVLFIGTVAWSVGHAMTMPGGGTFAERIAEWARDHDLGFVVTFGEWLSYQPPKKGGKPSFSLAGPSSSTGFQQVGRRAETQFGPPATLRTFARHPVPGEGHWRVLASVDGEPAIYGTYLRASPVYSSYVAGIVSMNQSLVRFELRPGAEDPGPGNWHAADWIPPGTRRGLLATFNSGFKIATSGGGFYLNGTRMGTLVKGVASEVYYRNGRLAIGTWGRSVHMTRQVVGVRQNLQLIVRGGQVPANVNNNVSTSWGATLGGGYYVWRSGIGITSDGRIIFVYGPALDVRELAELLKRAGAVTGMELDINPDWMSFMYYKKDGHPNDPTPVNLLPNQVQPPDRYYAISNRDFTAVYAR